MTMRADRQGRNQRAGDAALQIGGNVGGASIIAAGTGVTIIEQQAPAKEPNPPPTRRMTPAEVLTLIDSMPRDQRLSVLDFVVKHMGENILSKMDAHHLWRVQRYAQVIIERSKND